MARGNQILYAIAEAVFRRQRFRDRSDLARALGTTASSVAPWAHRLFFHRILQDNPDGLRFDEDRFLTYLTSLRIATLQPEPEFTTELSPDDALGRLRGFANITCMFTAGNSWAFFEPRRDLHIYVDRASLPLLREAIPRSRRPEFKDTRVQVYVESLDQIPHMNRQGHPVTSPLFTTIDLRAHPEGGAHAEFLRRNLLPRIRGQPE